LTQAVVEIVADMTAIQVINPLREAAALPGWGEPDGAVVRLKLRFLPD
jgi:hypothetical protein